MAKKMSDLTAEEQEEAKRALKRLRKSSKKDRQTKKNKRSLLAARREALNDTLEF